MTSTSTWSKQVEPRNEEGMQSGPTRKAAVGEGRNTTSKVGDAAAVAQKRRSVKSPVVYGVLMRRAYSCCQPAPNSELIMTGPGLQKMNQITNQPREQTVKIGRSILNDTRPHCCANHGWSLVDRIE
jgi:hypothetical protein